MNKKEKELINTLQVPSFKIKQATDKYAEGAKRVCKAFSDAAFSAREFEEALVKVNKMMNRKLRIQ